MLIYSFSRLRIGAVVACELLAVVVVFRSQVACGGCYAVADDVRVEGSSCVSARPLDENGCGNTTALVTNSCTSAAVFKSEFGTVSVAPGARDYEVRDRYATLTEGRWVAKGEVDGKPLNVSWISEHRAD